MSELRWSWRLSTSPGRATTATAWWARRRSPSPSWRRRGPWWWRRASSSPARLTSTSAEGGHQDVPGNSERWEGMKIYRILYIKYFGPPRYYSSNIFSKIFLPRTRCRLWRGCWRGPRPPPRRPTSRAGSWPPRGGGRATGTGTGESPGRSRSRPSASTRKLSSNLWRMFKEEEINCRLHQKQFLRR